MPVRMRDNYIIKLLQIYKILCFHIKLTQVRKIIKRKRRVRIQKFNVVSLKFA